jgi:8-oxo-dGTP diphosphatase
VTPTVRAAGGVVWRRAGGGDVEVLLVHRPRYDDWSLPKGKCDDGEDDVDCALREVLEETGMRCTLGPELASTSYRDRRGRSKVVRYWVMTVAEEGPWAPGDEVDERRWLPLADARRQLSYPHDRALLDALAAALPAR